MSNVIKTYERSDYIFTQASDEIFKFKIRAPREAFIALASKPAEIEPVYEIIIGTSNNQKSLIRKNFTDVLVAVETPAILSARELREFWICWKNNTISVGHEDDTFLSYAYTENELFDINYIGIRVGENEHGTWVMINSTTKYLGPGFWLPASGGNVPKFGVCAGYNNENLYIARAKHGGDLLPGCLVPSKGGCFVSFSGAEYKYTDYEVFCSSGGHWQPISGSDIPPYATKGGRTEDGEALYLGRVIYKDATLLGKVQGSYGCCFIPHEGKELSFKDYEIFIYEPFGVMELKR